MINLIFLYLILIIFSTFFSISFKKNIGYTFIISIISIIFTLYLFGLIGYLKAGVYFIKIISFFLLIYIIMLKNKNNLKKYVFNKNLLFFTILFIFLIIFNYGRLISAWDEFSHWGDVVKAMFMIDDFSTNHNSMSYFASYPPAVSLFQYFVLKLGNQYLEYQLYVAYQLIGISLIFPLINNVKSKNNFLFSILICLLVPIIIFNNYYCSIQVDLLLGLFFGYCVCTVILNSNYDNYFIINIIFSSFMLVLIKDVGLFFSIFFVVIMLFDLFFVKKIKFSNKNKKQIITIILVILMIVFAKVSWNINVSLNRANVVFDNKISIKKIIDLIDLNNLGYRKIVIENFIKGLDGIDIISNFINLNFIQLIILLYIIFLIVKNINKCENYKIVNITFVGLFIYTIGLLFLYCFSFLEYEAVNLISYTRYLSIYFVALFYIVSILFVNTNKNILLYLLVILLFVPYSKILFNIGNIKYSKDTRNVYVDSLELIRNTVDDNDKIYVISQNTTGFDYWVLKYLLRPNKVNENFTWSIGNAYNDDDIWTNNISAGEWLKYLKTNDFDYVFIYKSDEYFIEQFGILFDTLEDIKDKSLYKLEDNKLVLLD